MENLPIYVYLVFGLTVLAALFLFYRATNHSKTFLVIIAIWMAAQTVISLSGFYKITNSVPPRVGLLLLPPLIMTIILFSTKKGRNFIDGLDIKILTLFHIIRVPVELTLFWLFMDKLVPELMTFEGRNFDILSGISAPVIYYFVFVQRKLSRSVLLVWNFVCLSLLFNIVFNAILSVPGVFQQFAFDQPNRGILIFPFIFLPSLLVPMVLFSHLTAIRRILLSKAI
ncbi:hypothetical protein ACFP1I_24035 [Dyadobacter subterraneus]|uniref:Uncharacterized protein n=1 Tax=Dyadobacter subterraneus TaxID=2773304 RepID=A0ABR9WLT1_9BACT|nr:hypothetical protein [Dyadobacter subterraneus]MBE9466482.1 hypothetical protein [Dyadobacter subterraneus]